MTPPAHIEEDELERYCMGQIAAEADMDRIDDHVFACEFCGERAMAVLGFVDAMQVASVWRRGWKEWNGRRGG